MRPPYWMLLLHSSNNVQCLLFCLPDLRSGKPMRQVGLLPIRMPHWALTARQQGCLTAIRGHPPACGRHALLRPYRSSQSLKTSKRRSAPAAVASGAAACAADEAADDGAAHMSTRHPDGAAAQDEKASEELGADWMRNLPEDVKYDFIIFQIWILERCLLYVRDAAAKGMAYLPEDTAELVREEFDEGHIKLW